MKYPEITQPHNAKAVALFREHLPPHLADLCIDNHLYFTKRNIDVVANNLETLKDALGKCTDGDYPNANKPYAYIVYKFTTVNTVNLEAFYKEFPDLRPKEETTEQVIEQNANEAFNKVMDEKAVTKPPFTIKVIDCLTNELKQQHLFYRMVEAVGKFDELLSLCCIEEYAVMHNNLVGINQDGIMVILIEK